jgi:1,4-alpha-glucan branching enzyme
MTAITRDTPLGATLTQNGVAFRIWAPEAKQVFVLTDGALHTANRPDFAPHAETTMAPLGDGTWGAFVLNLGEAAPYRFWVVGTGSVGLKRDPRARELSIVPAYPECDCLVHDPASYPWHDHDFRPPEFRDLILYQLHVGNLLRRGCARPR